MGKGPEQTLFQGGHTEGLETYEGFSASPAIREMQIKTTMRYHFTPVRLAIINTSTNNKCWQGCGGREPFCIVDGTADWCSHCGKQYGDTLKN